MKNIFRFVMAVAILFTASCAKEDISSTIGGGEVEVTFTADLGQLGTRAYGEAKNVDCVYLGVYEANSTTPLTELVEADGYAVNNNGQASITVVLLKDKYYDLVFWAQDKNQTCYTVNWNGRTLDVDYDGALSQDDTRDAFFLVQNGFRAGHDETTFVLRRPFAQLRAGISQKDYDYIKANGVTEGLKKSAAKVYGVANVLNLVNGNVAGEETVTFNGAPVPTGDDAQFAVNGENFYQISMNYLLVNEKKLVDVEYNFSDGKTDYFRPYYNVPIQRNYRTNIIGQLISSPMDFNVIIAPDFVGEEEYKVVSVANVAEFKTAFENANVEGANTEISISDNINLSDLITRAANNLTITAKNANLVINGNGYTLTYEGQDRAIDVTMDAVNTNLTLKNVTIDCVASYCQRGVNYNTNGALTLESVTIKGKNITYALNCPGSSDNAKVEIINSNLTGNIALNLWGKKMVVNANNSVFTSVDNSTAEGYAAISLNNDGQGNSATGTIVNIVGGKIIALDENGVKATAIRIETDAEVNVSDETEVVGNRVQDVAIVTYKGTTDYYSFSSLKAAIEKAKDGPNVDCIRLIANVTSSEIIVLDFPVTLDGAGKTLTSTAGRAINVSGAENITIKNLTITASGERAINVIQNANNVTIENVTATAANYTVNVASSAPEAVVAIKNSTLNGLCTVNVSAAGAQVTIDNSVVNCNDNNTTAGEAYSALSLNKEAVGGSIIATNTTVNVAEGSDSSIARNSAPNGTVTINGSDKDVNVMVAFVTYPNSDYYYSFTTLQAAIDWVAENGEGNIEVIRTIVIDEDVEIDLKGQTVIGKMHKSVGAIIKNNGTLTIKNGTISSTAFNGGSTIANYGTLTVENVTLNGANGGDGSWPSYPVNNYATMTITNSSVNGYQGNIACNAAGTTTVNNCTLTKNYFKTSSHSFYINNADAEVIINGGTYKHNGFDGSLAYVNKGTMTVNDGTFEAKNGGYGMAALTNGKIVINGGNFNTPCLNWGGTIEINGSNLKK